MQCMRREKGGKGSAWYDDSPVLRFPVHRRLGLCRCSVALRTCMRGGLLYARWTPGRPACDGATWEQTPNEPLSTFSLLHLPVRLAPSFIIPLTHPSPSTPHPPFFMKDDLAFL